MVLDVQVSNIGKLDEHWLSEFYHALMSDSCQSGSCQLTLLSLLNYTQGQKKLRIIYPTMDQMEASAYKEHAWYFWYYHDHFKAGQPCCFGDQYFWYPEDTFPAPGILLHSKVYYCRREDKTGATEDTCTGWTYAGSHNLTRSAWGEQKVDEFFCLETMQRKERATLHIRNFELGVVFVNHVTSLPYDSCKTTPYSSGDIPWNSRK